MKFPIPISFISAESKSRWQHWLFAFQKEHNFNFEEVLPHQKSHIYFEVGESLVLIVYIDELRPLRLQQDLFTVFKNLKTSKKDLLYRAIVGQSDTETVVDLTAGLLKDSCYFLKQNLNVLAFERNPFMFLFSAAQLRIASEKNQIFSNLELKFGSYSSENIGELSRAKSKKTTFYFDPIFETSKRKSLPGKEMQIVRFLAEDQDQDAKSFFENLVQDVSSRIVVKRSTKTPSLGKPIHSFTGTTVVYDLYSGEGD